MFYELSQEEQEGLSSKFIFQQSLWRSLIKFLEKGLLKNLGVRYQ